MATNWTCPFCSRPQVITSGQAEHFTKQFSLRSHRFENAVGIEGTAIACSNPDCGEVSFELAFATGEMNNTKSGFKFVVEEEIEKYQLRPSYHAKPQPNYIPKVLRDSYLEACKIRDLSPKASATLARRCLQGMIRDFCGIVDQRTLFDEIQTLKKMMEDEKAPKGVSSESVDAIDNVRSIGNIGAHMEKDIDLIIDVDPNEAQILIELIETLFDEWYVESHQRLERFGKLKTIADNKAAMKTGAQPVAAQEAEEPKE